MPEKGTISSVQMAAMLYFAIMATAILGPPALMYNFAQQDMWISPIWASFIGALTLLLVFWLSREYPGQTYVQICITVCGPVLGTVIAAVYVLFYLHVNSIILREFVELVVSKFLYNTPEMVIVAGMMLLCAFAVRGGIEVIGRISQIVLPIILSILFLLFFFVIPEMNLTFMLPVFEHGALPSLKGAIPPATWFSEFFLLTFLLPFVRDGKARKWSAISWGAVMLSMVIVNIFVISLFGPVSGSFGYPVMTFIEYISISNFLEHLEAFVMMIWVVGAFVKISVFFYGVVLGTAQTFKLKDYRPIVLPLAGLHIVFNYWSLKNASMLAYYLQKLDPFYLVTFQTLLPLAMLLLVKVRKKRRKPA